MKRRMLIGALAVTAIVLTGCIGIESTVSFNNNGSGVVKMEYRISKILTEASEGGQAEVPLPVTEEEFQTAIDGHPGVKLVAITSREDETDLYMGAEISFDSIQSFMEVEDFNDMPMSLEKDGRNFVFQQVISEGSGETDDAGSAEMEAMLKEMFQGQEYELSFVVNAPSRIKSHNLGELSADGRTVRYALPFFDFISLKDETVLSVTW